MSDLLTEGRAHDAAMTLAPLVGADETDEDFAAIETTDGRIIAIMGAVDHGAMPDGTANAAGFAWMRNHLTALLDAAEERDRLKVEVERLRTIQREAGHTINAYLQANTNGAVEQGTRGYELKAQIRDLAHVLSGHREHGFWSRALELDAHPLRTESPRWQEVPRG